MKIAIIGAGPSGLVVARYLKDIICVQFDVFEKRDKIGGVWRERDSDVSEDDNINEISPVYDRLSTNTPIDTIKFEGLEYDGNINECFIPWIEVNKYLKKYAEKFKLMENIYLQTNVIQVSRINNQWKVKYRHLPSDEVNDENYDAVIVCSGHEDIPKLPHIEGVSNFQGIKMHSKKYRKPEPFSKQNILLIGAGPSGMDIAFQLSEVANRVYLSHHREWFYKSELANIIQKPDIKYISKDSVTFVDGTTFNIDVIIYCTGYTYNLDFLDKTCNISLGNRYIYNLYKNIISVEHTSLIFGGLLGYFFAFPMFEHQAKFIAKLVTGGVSLPSKEKMLEDTKLWEEKQRSEGKVESKFYEIGSNAEDYLNSLSDIGNIPRLPKALFELFEKFASILRNEPAKFKTYNFRLVNSTFVFE